MCLLAEGEERKQTEGMNVQGAGCEQAESDSERVFLSGRTRRRGETLLVFLGHLRKIYVPPRCTGN